MKTKWYFFFLTTIAVSAVIYALLGIQDEESVEIGVLMIGENRYEKFDGLKAGLEDLGYSNKEIQYIVKNANNEEVLLDTQIDELLGSKPDLIVTLGGIETQRLKGKMDARKIKIPVVFAGLAAPKELGLIKDYKAPGGLYTGINNYHASISGKRLEMLTSLVPDIEKVHVIYDSKIDVSELSLKETKASAKTLGVSVFPCDVGTKECMDTLWKSIKKKDAILVLPSFRIETLTDELVKLTQEKKIPSMGLYDFEAEKGLLASYGASFYSQGYQASRFVSLILQGNNPGDLPVELPDGIRFVINQQTKDSLGVTYNEDLLYIADLIHPEVQGGRKR
ncbi:ABC transporter substrate-binding protein [Mesobacillus subterraneus]|uniref:ABC transporter substrate-binding protein n=1 Tax=Mesobacillus subterraneus TaxID=285983 RepID=UPI00203FCFC4|nr:ABC transporter substrate-binding protein [Mesobacillus subterraneus]MCM3686020.1 ABC transporter substrate-binding protein [Mesobacillus subterraneus]